MVSWLLCVLVSMDCMTETQIVESENKLAQTIKVLERLADKEALHISLYPLVAKVGIYLSHLNIATHHFFSKW